MLPKLRARGSENCAVFSQRPFSTGSLSGSLSCERSILAKLLTIATVVA